MKIAVASIDGKVSQHFGHCDGFYLFDEENGTIHNKEFVQSPEHVPGLLPKFLADLVEVVVGATGDAMENVQEYLKGNLKSTGSICHHHEH